MPIYSFLARNFKCGESDVLTTAVEYSKSKTWIIHESRLP